MAQSITLPFLVICDMHSFMCAWNICKHGLHGYHFDDINETSRAWLSRKRLPSDFVPYQVSPRGSSPFRDQLGCTHVLGRKPMTSNNHA